MPGRDRWTEELQVDALQTNIAFDGHADASSIGVYTSSEESRQDVEELRHLRFARPR
jgi:hypothetical protein